MKKGFTLVELIAVIIILGIIALISTPIVVDIVKDSRINAGLAESNLIYNELYKYCDTEDVHMDDSYDKICTKNISSDDIKKIIKLGNAEILDIEYTNKIDFLKIKSNKNIYSLVNDKMILGDYFLLINKLLEQYKPENTSGLIKTNTNYYYKGTEAEVGNNYLWLGGHHFRILGFDTETKTIDLISKDPLTVISANNSVWTNNDEYSNSYINNWLNDYFYNSLNDEIKDLIVAQDFKVGPFDNIDSVIIKNKVGLLNLKQYETIGGKNSYLNNGDYWWLANPNSDKLYTPDSLYSSKSLFGVRPILKIKNILVENNSNDGSKEKSFEKVKKNTELQNGEYIKIKYNGTDNECDEYCTFRIVGNDSNSYKITLNGTLQNSSEYGPNNEFSKDSTVYKVVNNFVNDLNQNILYKDLKKFYMGACSTDCNYAIGPQKQYIESNFGLPTIGELLSTNELNSGRIWLMNRSNIYIQVINSTNEIWGENAFVKYSVRPVIYIKKDVKITSGTGSSINPYIIE